MRYCLLSGRLFMSVIAVLLFVAVTSYGNNLGKAPIQLNKDKICNKSKTMERDTIKLHIGSKVFVAVLENNSSAMALKELLAKCNVTVEMSDYAHMEKFGSFGMQFPTNDETITTEAGDVILSEGNLLVIYYAPNTWNFTRLGKVRNLSETELKQVLGKGSITAVLTLSDDE